MGNTISIRLTEEQRAWLEQRSRKTGLPISRIIRESIDKSRADHSRDSWRSLAGSVKGLPADLSSRKGFSRS